MQRRSPSEHQCFRGDWMLLCCSSQLLSPNTLLRGTPPTCLSWPSMPPCLILLRPWEFWIPAVNSQAQQGSGRAPVSDTLRSCHILCEKPEAELSLAAECVTNAWLVEGFTNSRVMTPQPLMPEWRLLSYLRSASKLSGAVGRVGGAVGVICRIQHIDFTFGFILDKLILTRKFSRSLKEYRWISKKTSFKNPSSFFELSIGFIYQRGLQFEVHTGRVKVLKAAELKPGCQERAQEQGKYLSWPPRTFWG